MKAVLALLLVASAAAVSARVLYDRTVFPAAWTRQARASPLHEVQFIIALKQQNLPILNEVFNAVSDPQSPRYQQFLTTEEILNIVAPPKEDHDLVVAWLKQHGARRIRSHGDAIEVRTNVAVAERLFSTKFYHFQHKATGKNVVRVYGPYSVPEQVSPYIHMVAGLSEMFPPHLKIHRAPNAGSEAIVPQSIFEVYGVPDAAAIKSNTSQGVIEFEEQYFDPSGLASFAQQMGVTIKALPADRIIGTNDPSQPGDESMLDIEYIAAVGLGVDNWFWIEGGTTWLYGFATHFFGSKTFPYVISISYGWSESDQCEEGIGAEECAQLGVDSYGYVARVNTEFQKIGAKGVSILVASGDSGTNGRTDPDCTNSPYTMLPDYPAASPYITSVGATQMNNPKYALKKNPPACLSQGYACVSGGDEVAVSFDHANFASGGGFSNVAALQDWQKTAVADYFKSGVPMPTQGTYNSTGRGYPDVSAFGSDVLIYDGGLEPVGGTSCSAPIFGGVVGLLNDYSLSSSGKPLGFLNPLLYQMHAADASAFIDITVGDNKCTEDGCQPTCQGFNCAKGWDPVTGLGSPNYPKMLAYLKGVFARKAKAPATPETVAVA